jgi:hypothetical protein
LDGIAVFAAGYTTAVIAGALGLDWVGEVTARRRPGGARDEPAPSWPHSGSIAVHTVIATVAAVAGLLVVAAVAIGHHSLADLLVMAVPAALAVAVLRRFGRRLAAARREAGA